MKRCDVCGNDCTDLVDLLEQYQSDGIKEICRDCETVINKQNSKLLGVVLAIKQTWLHRFMQNLKAKAMP